jgi:serine phosphatase RsbU (regulator of sigma subunit)
MLTPAVDLATVAARYLPAVAGLAVGGDWYDVIDVDPQRRALVVGDCVGHGLGAATAMAQLRVAARTLLLEDRDPAATLTALDTFAQSVDGADFASIMCAIFDTTTSTLTYSRAGHPPALLVRDGEPVWLDDATGPPLCVDFGRERQNATVATNEGDLLVMYSDGLIERRAEALDTGFDRLADATLALHREHVQHIADGLLARLEPDNTRDDVVLVVKRLTRTGRQPAPVPAM